MKKILMTILLVAIVCQSCASNEKGNNTTETSEETTAIEKESPIDRVFNEFKNEEGIEKIKLGRFMMAFAKTFTGLDGIKGIDGIDVYSLESCSREVKERYNAAIKTLSEDGSYETLVSSNSSGNNMKVMVKISEELIREVVVLTGGNDPTLVRIKGKIKTEDIEKMLNENK